MKKELLSCFKIKRIANEGSGHTVFGSGSQGSSQQQQNELKRWGLGLESKA